VLGHTKHKLDVLGNVLAGRIGHLPINNEGIASEGEGHFFSPRLKGSVQCTTAKIKLGIVIVPPLDSLFFRIKGVDTNRGFIPTYEKLDIPLCSHLFSPVTRQY